MVLNIFNVACLFIVISALLVVMSKNALHSIIFLVANFFFSAITIFLLENEFLALFFLIIYLGAILILFLFVVMMLDLKHNTLRAGRLHLPTGIVLGFLSFAFVSNRFSALLSPGGVINVTEVESNLYVNWHAVLEQASDLTSLSGVLYHNYAPQILMAGLLLYTSTVGVVFLTSNRHRSISIKSRQSLTKQLSRNNVL